MKVYIDDMIVKISKGESHITDVKDILELVMRYNMCLNPAKFFFGV